MATASLPALDPSQPRAAAGATRPDANRRDTERLMVAYQRGDQAAFRALFQHYAPVVLRLGRRHLGNDDSARELVQQTFLKLHGSRHDYREGERLHPWLMTIVMNLIRDQWRRNKRKPTAPLEREPVAPERPAAESLEAQQRAAGLHVALGQLTERQREVVELHWFQDHSFAEVARMVGSTEGAVRVQAHRAYTALRGLLKEKRD